MKPSSLRTHCRRTSSAAVNVMASSVMTEPMNGDGEGESMGRSSADALEVWDYRIPRMRTTAGVSMLPGSLIRSEIIYGSPNRKGWLLVFAKCNCKYEKKGTRREKRQVISAITTWQLRSDRITAKRRSKAIEALGSVGRTRNKEQET